MGNWVLPALMSAGTAVAMGVVVFIVKQLSWSSSVPPDPPRRRKVRLPDGREVETRPLKEMLDEISARAREQREQRERAGVAVKPEEWGRPPPMPKMPTLADYVDEDGQQEWADDIERSQAEPTPNFEPGQRKVKVE